MFGSTAAHDSWSINEIYFFLKPLLHYSSPTFSHLIRTSFRLQSRLMSPKITMALRVYKVFTARPNPSKFDVSLSNTRLNDSDTILRGYHSNKCSASSWITRQSLTQYLPRSSQGRTIHCASQVQIQIYILSPFGANFLLICVIFNGGSDCNYID